MLNDVCEKFSTHLDRQSCFLFFIWLCRALVAARGIFSCRTQALFSCGMWTLSCGMWDLVPWPGIEPGPPALGAWCLSHCTNQGGPGFLIFFYLFLFIFLKWPLWEACRILVPQTGIEPEPPVVEVWSLNHWTTRKVLTHKCVFRFLGVFFEVFIEFVTVLLHFMFWCFGRQACGILAPRPGIKPTPPAVEGEVLTNGLPGKSHDT